MSQNIQSGSPSVRMDRLKWMLALLALIATVVASNVVQSTLIRWGILIVGLGLCFGAAILTTKGQEFKRLFIGARGELRKIVWPTRQETVQASFLILAMIFVSAILLWMVDNIIWRIVAWVTGFKA